MANSISINGQAKFEEQAFTQGSTNVKQVTSGFSLNSFMTDIRTRGVVKTNSFIAVIDPPQGMIDKGYAGSEMKRVAIRCDSASLPSMALTTQEFMRYGYGSLETIPYNVNFEPVNLSFILDSQAEIYTFFYRWMNSIVNFNFSGGIGGTINYGGVDMKAYEVGYKSTYASTVHILVYNEDSDNIIEVTLYQAFPSSLSEVNLNWESNSEIIKLNIPINYRDFSIKTVDPKNLDQTSNVLIDATVPGGDFFTRAVSDEVNIGSGKIKTNSSAIDTFLGKNRITLKPVQVASSAPTNTPRVMTTPGQFRPSTIR